MKKLSHLLLIVAAAAFVFTACEGPAGPEGATGPAGPTGATGQIGPQGPTGANGTAGCIVCHDDSQSITAKSAQWEASVHAMGGNFERNGESCNGCHTSQGFVERIATGDFITGAVSDPASINCYTCHNIHETYTAADLALKTTAPVTFLVDGVVSDQGNSNLCINCHQSREGTVPNFAATADDSLTVSSSRYGPHHGPQGNTFVGASTVKFAGTTPIPAGNVHSNASCIMCHMGEAYGTQAGGHTMGMNYEYHGADALFVKSCLICHDSETETTMHAKTDAVVAEVEGLLVDLADALVARGVMSVDIDGNYTQLTGKFKEIEAGAMWNWKFFGIEDPGAAVHNPKYVKALLKNSIEALEDLAPLTK